ncbi:MAG: type II secretion system protein [Planctomycetes bacterium]|nr:type II secretion system protein [Planctomycetota bacterium]
MRTNIKNRVNRAFTLIEILIVVVILGILAAIVIPQFTDASQEAMEASVVTQLQTIRSQIELHNVQWPNRVFEPLTDALAPWGQLTTGDLAFDLDYDGDYLQSPPNNPLQGGSSTVAGAAADTVGWVWANPNGWGISIYAVDVTGLALVDLDADGNAD